MYRSIRTDNEEVHADVVEEESYEKFYKFYTTILIITYNTLAALILINILYLCLSSIYLTIYLFNICDPFLCFNNSSCVQYAYNQKSINIRVSIKSGQRVKR